MIKYYLKAEDEATMNASLVASGLVDANMNCTINFCFIHVVGKVLKNFDLSINPIEFVDGWHVNIISKDPLDNSIIEKLPIIESPTNPFHEWLGE